MRRTTCFTLLAFCCLAGAASAEETLKIGVFDQRATGGQGAGVDGLIRGLERLGYATERLCDLDALSLAQCDVVYLSDMHSPGHVQKDWRRNLTAFVRAGGSVLRCAVGCESLSPRACSKGACRAARAFCRPQDSSSDTMPCCMRRGSYDWNALIRV